MFINRYIPVLQIISVKNNITYKNNDHERKDSGSNKQSGLRQKRNKTDILTFRFKVDFFPNNYTYLYAFTYVYRL